MSEKTAAFIGMVLFALLAIGLICAVPAVNTLIMAWKGQL